MNSLFYFNIIPKSNNIKIVLLEPIGINSSNIANIKSDFEALGHEFNSFNSRPESKEKLQLLKPSSILINTACGAVVDYSALNDLLKKNLIAGTAIDVYDKEPPLNENHSL